MSECSPTDIVRVLPVKLFVTTEQLHPSFDILPRPAQRVLVVAFDHQRFVDVVELAPLCQFDLHPHVVGAVRILGRESVL
jgi:hypothetical protein